MVRLRFDQQKEANDCHYVVTLPTQIFPDAKFAETASCGTSFVGMAEGDLWMRTVHRYIRKCNSRRDRIRPDLLNDDIYCRDPALPTCISRAPGKQSYSSSAPAGRASCRVRTTPVKLAVHPIPGVSLRYWHPLTESPTVFVIDDDANVRTPIIFLAAHGDFSTTVTALKSGAVEFVTKPID
jgi:hypothetical protein